MQQPTIDDVLNLLNQRIADEKVCEDTFRARMAIHAARRESLVNVRDAVEMLQRERVMPKAPEPVARL